MLHESSEFCRRLRPSDQRGGTVRPVLMPEIGNRPIPWHISKIQARTV